MVKYALQMVVQDIEQAVQEFKKLPKSESTKELIGLVGIGLFILLLCFI